ncbi:MAG: Flagellar hook-associated protein 3 [Pseudomonadota bacterium]
MKVSTSLFFERASTQLGNVQGSLAKTQEQLSTGKQITKPSDEPDKASTVTRLESEMARQKSYQETLTTVQTRLTSQETSLRNVSDVLIRIKELTVQAANDTVSSADRKAIGLEIIGLRDQLLSQANAQDTNGNFLFAGSRSTQAPYALDANGHITYQGDQSRMKVQVGDNRRMNANTPGSDVFLRVIRDDGKGNQVGVNFFEALKDLSDAITNGLPKDMDRGLGEIDILQQGISNATAQIGSDMSVVDMQNSVLDETTLRLKSTLSDVQDLDYTEAITRMNKDQLALEAAQSTFAKIAKLTLFNYIN